MPLGLILSQKQDGKGYGVYDIQDKIRLNYQHAKTKGGKQYCYQEIVMDAHNIECVK